MNTLKECHNELLHQIAVKENLVEFRIHPQNANTGDNFMGVLFKITIEGRRKTDEEIKINLFLKYSMERMRKTFHLHEMYCNEIFFYETLSEVYTRLQKNYLIPKEEIIHFPKYYGSIKEEFNETIVLEDLSHDGYKLFDRFQSITLDYAKTCVEILAKFHSLSYVLAKKDPEFFEKFIEPRKGNMYRDYEAPERLKKQAPMITENAVKSLSNKAYTEKIEIACKDICQNINDYVRSNNYPTLCHGDFKIDNLLLKYSENKISSIMLVDYQLIHYGSPLNDLMYFIFGSTDSEFRAKHFEYIMEFYYHSLKTFTALFSIDINDVYPKEHFDADLKSHMKMGLLIAVNFLPYVLVNKDKIPNLKPNESFMQVTMRTPSELYLKRYNGLIEDLAKWGYL